MTDSTIGAGKDAWVSSSDVARPEPKRPRLTSGTAQILVSLPSKQQVVGRSVTSAILSGVARNDWAAQTLTVGALTGRWNPRTAVWNEPIGASVSEAIPATAQGERFEVDVTTLVQAIAAGADDFGYRIRTNSAAVNRARGFATGLSAWQLEIEFADEPDAPVPLSPLGGAVGIEPVVAWDYVAGGGDEDSEQVSSRVWVNTSPTQTGAVDSGWVANELPEFDLSDLSGWVPADGVTYYWQVQVRDGGLNVSEVSDWAEFTFRPYPYMTVTNPVGVAWDTTPTFAFNVSPGVIRQYRIEVFGDADGRKRYDSGWTTVASPTSVERTLPAKWNGARIHVDDRVYRYRISVRDRIDREATGLDPGAIVRTGTYVMDEDATATAPSNLLVSQIGDSPRTRWVWQRASGVAAAWEFGTGDRVLARVDGDDDAIEVTGTTYSWTCDSLTAYVNHSVWVRAIDDGTGKATAKTPEHSIRMELGGVWLLSEHGDVMLDGVDVEGMRARDSRAVYSPIGLEHDIDIVYALKGKTGTFLGGIESTRGRDWEADMAVLRAMRSATDEPIRFAYGTVNYPIILRDLDPDVPSSAMLPHNMKHVVAFGAEQVDEFGDA